MEFTAKRRVLKVTIEDKTHEVLFPTLGQITDYQMGAQSNMSDGNVGDLLSKLLETLGFPVEAQMAVDQEAMTTIIGLLFDQKKV